MHARIKALREERHKLVLTARQYVDAADKQKRPMTAEENASFDKAHADIETQGEEIKRLEKQAAIESDLDKSQGRATEPDQPGDKPQPSKTAVATEFKYEVGAYRRKPVCERVIPILAGPTSGEAYRKAFGSFLAFGDWGPHYRAALEGTADTKGGYSIAPQQMAAGLLQAIDNQTFVRQRATVTRVPSAKSLGIVSLDADPADATWTSELLTGSEDSTMAFGKRELYPHPLAQRIKVSNLLLRQSFLNVEGLVNERMAYKFGVVTENAYLNGTGANRPQGMFIASADGISTGRDVSTDNTTTAMTADGLKNAKYTLKGGYWGRAEWIFHRDAVKMIAKFKDGSSRYLWQDSIVQGEPDRLLGFPVNISEYAPSTFTTGLYVGLLGDLSYYHIADALDLTFQRLAELYAETNQTGFIARLETDGMPVLEEAFVRVKLA